VTGISKNRKPCGGIWRKGWAPSRASKRKYASGKDRFESCSVDLPQSTWGEKTELDLKADARGHQGKVILGGGPEETGQGTAKRGAINQALRCRGGDEI